MKMILNPAYPQLEPFVNNIETHFQQSSEILYDQRNQIRLVSYEGERYVVKSFRVPHRFNRFVYRYLRASKARRSFEYSMKMGKKFSPEPIAYIEEYSNTLLTKSYYICKYYDHDFTIRPVLLDADFDSKTRQRVLQAFAEFTYDLHENDIYHRDYSYGNILIRESDHSCQFNIIDVNRMVFKRLTFDERMKNFARLQAQDDQMEIIITRYAQVSGEPAEPLMALAKKHRDTFIKNRRIKNTLRGR